MMGLIVALTLLIFKVEITTVLLAFIGFELCDISISIAADQRRKRKHWQFIMDVARSAAQGMKEGLNAGRDGQTCNGSEEDDGK